MYRVFVNDDTVPAEEFEQIQQRLHDNNIDVVERSHLIGSFFRFGSRGAGCDLLVRTETEYAQARAIIDRYQEELVEKARAEFEANRADNRQREIVGWAIAAAVVLGLVALWLSVVF